MGHTTQTTDARKPSGYVGVPRVFFVAGQDLNQRLSGYEFLPRISGCLSLLVDSVYCQGFADVGVMAGICREPPVTPSPLGDPLEGRSRHGARAETS